MRRWHWLLAAFFTLAWLLTGCSYDHVEPGLFGQSAARETSAPPIRPVTPDERAQTPNPDLPVVGEATWTSADGFDITMRVAVHAVRRTEGATVLDWSVTPLRGAGLQAKDPLPTAVNLGANEGYPNILLVDAARARVYRPLTLRGWDSQCLCTPLMVAQRNLRVGYTTVLQVAFPALPDDLTNVDVLMATVPPFWHVPVTPRGMLPLASYPADLARPADPAPVIGRTGPFSYGLAGQRYRVMINVIYTSRSFTSIAWTIQSMESGRGLQAASTPPFADATPPRRAYNPISAAGPQVKVAADRSVRRARLVTTKLAGLGALECLCTDLRFGAAGLHRAGQQLHVITNLPPVPAGTSRVDVVLPGVRTFTNLPVTAAPDSTFRSAGPAVREVGLWTYRAEQSGSGWRPRDWPTPLPRTDQLGAFRATVDTIVR